MSPRLSPVRRVAVTPDEVGAWLDSPEPVVFSDLARAWPATGRWSPAHLAAAYGDHPIRVYAFTHRDAIPTSMAAFVAWLDGARRGSLADFDDGLYLAWDASVLRANPTLADQVSFAPWLGRRRGVVRTGFWMGGAGAHTPLHTDIDALNLHAVIYGEKRFWLFGPDQTEHLYPSDVYEWTTVFSGVDIRAPDLARYPAAAGARGFDVRLRAGDVLLIPIGWWHAAMCLWPAISINAWHMSPRVLLSRNLYRDLGRALLHRLGLYARGRCTCCGHGDLRRHLRWDQPQPSSSPDENTVSGSPSPSR